MVVQAQAAQTLAASDTDRAREAMQAVEDAGRTALVEMLRLLGVIRADGPVGAPGDRAPQPRLEDLPGLVQRVREAGACRCRNAIEGDPDGVPAGVAVCAYRIVQEALSNVVRHCGAVAARGRLRVSDSALDVAVENVRLAVRCRRRRMAGEGLAGMRERVAVFNGRLETGPLSDGGFAVRCCRWGSGDDPGSAGR